MLTCTLEAEPVGRIRQRTGIPPPGADRPADPGDDGWITVRAVIAEAVVAAVQRCRLPERIPEPGRP